MILGLDELCTGPLPVESTIYPFREVIPMAFDIGGPPTDARQPAGSVEVAQSAFGDGGDASETFRDQLMSKDLKVVPQAVQVAQAAPNDRCKDPQIQQTDQSCQQGTVRHGGFVSTWFRNHIWAGHSGSATIGPGPTRDTTTPNGPKDAPVATVTPKPTAPAPAESLPAQKAVTPGPTAIEAAPRASTAAPAVHAAEVSHGSYGAHVSVHVSA